MSWSLLRGPWQRVILKYGAIAGVGWRVRKDGTRFFASVVIDPIFEKRKLLGFAKITRDITEREKTLSELLKSESQFKTLVGGVTDYAGLPRARLLRTSFQG